MTPRFDVAAKFIADTYGFATDKDPLHDLVWTGSNFLEQIRASGRYKDRRTLSVKHRGIFLTLTVDPAATTEELLDVLRLTLEAIAVEEERASADDVR